VPQKKRIGNSKSFDWSHVPKQDGNSGEEAAMFESTLAAQGLHERERKLGTMSAVALAHLGIGLAILAVTALVVPPIRIPEPPIRGISITTERIRLDDLSSPSKPPAAKKGSASPKAPTTLVTPPVPEPQTPHPPTDLPVVALPVDAPPGPGGKDDGPLGDPDGSPTGVPGGQGHDTGGSGDGGNGDPALITGDMQRPVLLQKVEPEYPIVARRAGLGGRVTLQAVIAPDGSVESVEILASTNPIFNAAAVDAVRRWRYKPALMNGAPVRVYFTVVVDFVVR
jgi:protein TonB